MSKAAPAGAGAGVPPEPVLRKIRIPFVQRARLVHAGRAREVFLVDLGMQGVFAELEAPLAAGDDVEVRFPLPGNEIPIVARCRVAWWHAPGEPPKGLPGGVGLAFAEMSWADRDRVREHVAEHCRRTPRGPRFSRRWPGDGGEEESA
jgi:hypothetical protein